MTAPTSTPNTPNEENPMPTTTPTILTGWQADNVKARMEAVARTLRQHEKWNRLCDQYGRMRRAFGEQDPRTIAAMQAWEKGRPVGKARKHQTYSDARTIANVCGVEAPAEVRGTVEEWRWAIDVAERACFRV